MRAVAILACLVLLAACASWDGRGLEPGRSTAVEVRAAMGAPDAVREAAQGGAVWYYSRQPWGRRIFAVRIGTDGVLRAIEQTLTYENIAKLRAGETTMAAARDLLGPPWEVVTFERLAREVWTYHIEQDSFPRLLHLQFSADRLVREVYVVDESSPLPRWFFRF